MYQRKDIENFIQKNKNYTIDILPRGRKNSKKIEYVV